MAMGTTIDGKILEQKLLLRELTVGGGLKTSSTVTKISNKVHKYLTSLNVLPSGATDTTDKSSNVQSENDYESLIREIRQYQYEMTKVKNIFVNSTKEIESYNNLNVILNEKISTAKSDITSLEKELFEEGLIREHRLKCEEVASNIKILSATAQLNTKIIDMENTLLGDKDSVLTIEQGIQQRSRQFDQLMDSFNVLISKLGGNDDIDTTEMSIVVDFDDQADNYCSMREGDDEGRNNARKEEGLVTSHGDSNNDLENM